MAITTQAINMSALINMIRKSFIPLMPDCFASSTRSEIEKSDIEIKVYIYIYAHKRVSFDCLSYLLVHRRTLLMAQFETCLLDL